SDCLQWCRHRPVRSGAAGLLAARSPRRPHGPDGRPAIRMNLVLHLLALATAFGGDSTERAGSTRYPDIVFESAMSLSSRIHEAFSQILSNYRIKGLTNPKPHVLTPGEQTVVEKAFDILPPLNGRVLTNHLASIFFIEDMPNGAATFPMQRANS